MEVAKTAIIALMGLAAFLVLISMVFFGWLFNWGLLILCAMGGIGFIYLKIFGGK